MLSAPPQQTQQQRRVSFREPVDAPPPPLPRTVSDDAETPPKETDDVLKLVDSWGASPDDEAKRLAQLRADEEQRRASEAHAESARDVHRITEPPRSEEWMASHAHARPRVDDGERANGRVRSRARRGDGERETRERRGERRAGWCTCTISRCKNREA